MNRFHCKNLDHFQIENSARDPISKWFIYDRNPFERVVLCAIRTNHNDWFNSHSMLIHVLTRFFPVLDRFVELLEVTKRNFIKTAFMIIRRLDYWGGQKLSRFPCANSPCDTLRRIRNRRILRPMNRRPIKTISTACRCNLPTSNGTLVLLRLWTVLRTESTHEGTTGWRGTHYHPNKALPSQSTTRKKLLTSLPLPVSPRETKYEQLPCLLHESDSQAGEHEPKHGQMRDHPQQQRTKQPKQRRHHPTLREPWWDRDKEQDTNLFWGEAAGLIQAMQPWSSPERRVRLNHVDRSLPTTHFTPCTSRLMSGTTCPAQNTQPTRPKTLGQTRRNSSVCHLVQQSRLALQVGEGGNPKLEA